MLHRQRFVSIFAALILIALWYLFSSNQLSYTTSNDPHSPTIEKDALPEVQDEGVASDSKQMKSIMPSMPDPETKKEVGRASWKYFHTLLARFPDEPSEEERQKLSTFIQLYAELYPCGECSYHFVKMLQKYPPQTSSRTTAALWGCHVHNIVNEYLGKPEYDCATILKDYDCGCGDENGKINDDLKLNKVSIEKEGKQGG